MIAALKFAHIAGLSVWVAALIALPLLLHVHGGARQQREFIEFRLVTHLGYIAFATPAALIAIAAGTALIFLAGVYEPWLLLKLAFVAGMVLVHAWFGHLIQRSGEERRSEWRRQPLTGLALALPLIAAVLALALAKPAAGTLLAWVPAAIRAPQELAP